MYSQFRAMNQMQHAVHVFLQFKTCLLSLLMVQHRSYPAYVNWIKIISWVFGYLCEYHIFNPVMFHPKIGSCRAGSRSSVLVFWVISKPDTIGREVQKLFSLFTTRKVLHNSNNKQLEFCGNQCTAPPCSCLERNHHKRKVAGCGNFVVNIRHVLSWRFLFQNIYVRCSGPRFIAA